jgi:hypothetical protein
MAPAAAAVVAVEATMASEASAIGKQRKVRRAVADRPAMALSARDV